MTGTRPSHFLCEGRFVFASLSRILRFARSQTPSWQHSRSRDMGVVVV
jgi:hypothetical protein